MSGIKFEPGQIVATPGALEAFRASGEDPLTYLVRHLNGDWGDLSADDVRENELSLETRLANPLLLSAQQRSANLANH